MSRKLLYLQPAGDIIPMPPALWLQDWEPTPVATPERAYAAATATRFGVGLLGLDGLNDLGRDWRDLMLALQRVRWIALVARERLASNGIRQLLRDHCHDYHVLPLDQRRLLDTLGHAWGMSSLDGERASEPASDSIAGESESIRHILRLIPKLAGAGMPVLIHGESGTGKELAARAIHDASPRSGMPFIAVNCGALPGSLVHTELFGHERGAFTGASQRRIGRIESAHGGTLFLDEIGDLPLEMQVNLLRFLQEGTIERLGSDRVIPVDARIIAATHVDLEERVATGHFREDLYYRINVLRLDIPPLRDRRGDIPLLAQRFFDTANGHRNPRTRGFSRQAVEVLENHHWPGNVRELLNRVRRAMVLCESPLITPEHLGLERRRQLHRRVTTLAEARQEAELAALHAALVRHRHNHSEAARELGISRATFYRTLRRHGVDVPGTASA